jgi:protein-tyrosine phosphatase
MNQPSDIAGDAARLAQATIDRLVPLQGALNFRDMGGYRTQDGRRVRPGKLFRAGSLSKLTEQDRDYVRAIGLRTICDLRTTLERTNEPNLWVETTPIAYWTRDYGTSFGELRGVLGQGLATAELARQAMVTTYQRLPFEQAPAYREIFRRLADGDVPLLLHCSAGKDRAGTGAALILSALGVPRETVVADYVLSDHVAEARQRSWAKSGDPRNPFATVPPEIVRVILGAEADYIAAAFAAIDERHGGLEAYLADELGVGAEQLAALHALLLE